MTLDRKKHMCTEPRTHANTCIWADIHTTSNKWKMTQCDRRRLSGAAGSVSSLQTHTYKECLNTQNVCCSALKCPTTGITRNMFKVQNYTFVCFFCVHVCLYLMWLLYWLPPLALGAICFQSCVGSSICMRLCARLWYLSNTCKLSTHTPSLAVLHAWIRAGPL